MLIAILLALSLSFCTKDEESIDDTSPSNLTVSILEIDNDTREVKIQATAVNAVSYQLFVNQSDEYTEENQTGFFTYIFEEDGVYPIEVRAFGSSGKYVKTTKQVEIIAEDNTVPLDHGYISPEEYEGYNLLWQDEFNGTQVNTNDWAYDIGTGSWGWGNNELQYYRKENSWVADNVLTIEAKKENFGGQSYTSSRLKTQQKFSYQYGRIDTRALLPKGKGLWPAIWMLGDNITQVSWPDCGEIDIMEMIGDTENQVHGTAHWEYDGTHASSGGTKTLLSTDDNYSEAYHVFSVIWDENTLKWFVDDQQYYTLDITGADMSEFHQSYFLILNLAVGGNWPGSPDQTTIFPQQMKVDYIRVFQKQ